ncbi:hypothetical protein GE21DRAFT_1207034, partial [Neurospora crassa]
VGNRGKVVKPVGCRSVDVGNSDGTGPVEVGGRASSTRQTPVDPSRRDDRQTFPACSSSPNSQDPSQGREPPVGPFRWWWGQSPVQKTLFRSLIR